MSDPNTMFRVDGKVALITGAARGIGDECASMLAKAGAKVVLTDILEEAGEANAKAIRDKGGEAIFIRHDVTSQEDWERVVAAALEKFGGLDILVNNAGIEISVTLENMTLEEWQRVQNVNSTGTFLGTKFAVEAMKPEGPAGNGGSIVNLSSIAGLVGFAGGTAYSASKGSIRLFSRSAAIECATQQYGIRVNSLHPGFIMTDMASQVLFDLAELWFDGDVEAATKHYFAQTPIGHFGSTVDIAAAVLYLCSEAGRFITGAELVVDGGLTAA